MARVHAGRRDGLHLLGSQLDRGETAALRAKPLQRLILDGRDEVAGDLAMAGHCDRLALRLHPVAAEVAGKLRREDGFRHGRGCFLPFNYYGHFACAAQGAHFEQVAPVGAVAWKHVLSN